MSFASPSSRSTSSRLRWGRNRAYSSCLQMVAMSATGGTGERAVRRSSRMGEGPTLRRSMTMPSRSPSRAASGHRRARGGRGVLTLEVLELLQMVDVAGRVDAGHADVGHRQAIDTERVLLPLVVERSFAPGDADPRRD